MRRARSPIDPDLGARTPGVMLDAVGWGGEELASPRRFAERRQPRPLSAPIDALYAATEINEYAYEAAAAELAGETAPRPRAKRQSACGGRSPRSATPAVLAMQAAAGERGVAFLWDDDEDLGRHG